jgi:ubiquinol-cytochrome c reductase cytochrome c subunit
LAAAPYVEVANVKPPEGRAVFVSNGCAACHGVNAQGTNFAPTLIGITKKYPPAQLTDLLHHPKKEMRDGGMPAVKVNDEQMKQLVAYLSGLGTASAAVAAGGQGAPPAAASSVKSATGDAGNASKEVKVVPLSAEAVRGRAVFQSHSCETCHGTEGLHGTVAAPGLAGFASILPAPVLEDLLRHHSIRMQKGGMPLTNMNTRDMTALVAYIRSMPTPGG